METANMPNFDMTSFAAAMKKVVADEMSEQLKTQEKKLAEKEEDTQKMIKGLTNEMERRLDEKEEGTKKLVKGLTNEMEENRKKIQENSLRAKKYRKKYLEAEDDKKKLGMTNENLTSENQRLREEVEYWKGLYENLLEKHRGFLDKVAKIITAHHDLEGLNRLYEQQGLNEEERMAKLIAHLVENDQDLTKKVEGLIRGNQQLERDLRKQMEGRYRMGYKAGKEEGERNKAERYRMGYKAGKEEAERNKGGKSSTGSAVGAMAGGLAAASYTAKSALLLKTAVVGKSAVVATGASVISIAPVLPVVAAAAVCSLIGGKIFGLL